MTASESVRRFADHTERRLSGHLVRLFYAKVQRGPNNARMREPHHRWRLRRIGRNPATGPIR
jgi:hypothetical protein